MRGARILCAVALLLALCAVGAAGKPPAKRGADRPNVVVIMTDDQTVESLRVMPQVRKLLARQGATFDNSFASFPLCCPSRSTFLTGQYMHNHGVVGNNVANGLARLDQSSTLPVWLQQAGYSTVFIGKYLNEYKRLMYRRIPPGWDEWYGALKLSYFNHSLNRNGTVAVYGSTRTAYQTDVYTRQAVDVIQRHAGDRPFFLWLSYFAPHYGGPKEAGDPLYLKTAVSAPRHRGRYANEALPQSPSFNEADVSDKPASIRARHELGAEDVADLTRGYQQRLESLLAVDEGVAEVVSALRDERVLANTLIVFTSDNGYLQGEHRVDGGKEQAYEESIRVPLIVRGPGVPRDVHLPQLAVNADLAPTILEAAGAVPGRVQDGRSLLPLFADPGLEWGRDILLERGPGGNSTANVRLYAGLRTPRYKYLEYSTGERELYDLEADPYELQSLDTSPAHAGVEEALAARLAALRDCVGPACSSAPALQLRAVEEGGCARAVGVGGDDELHVRSVDFFAQGNRVALDVARPFEQPVAAGQTAWRALAVLDDGRRLTVDAIVRPC